MSIHVLMAWLRQSDIVQPSAPAAPTPAERLHFDRLIPQPAPQAALRAAAIPSPPQDRWTLSREFSLPIRAVAVRRPNFTVSPELLTADAKQERWQYQITRPAPAPPPAPLAVMPAVPLPPLPPPALPPPRVLPAYAGEAFEDHVYDDLFDPPVPKPEPVRLLSLIDRLPDRLTGAERASPALLGRLLGLSSVVALLLGTLGYFWLR